MQVTRQRYIPTSELNRGPIDSRHAVASDSPAYETCADRRALGGYGLARPDGKRPAGSQEWKRNYVEQCQVFHVQNSERRFANLLHHIYEARRRKRADSIIGTLLAVSRLRGWFAMGVAADNSPNGAKRVMEHWLKK